MLLSFVGSCLRRLARSEMNDLMYICTWPREEGRAGDSSIKCCRRTSWTRRRSLSCSGVSSRVLREFERYSVQGRASSFLNDEESVEVR